MTAHPPHTALWTDIIRRVVDVAPVDRLAVVSRLILSAQNDASRVASNLLQNATTMVRINVPVDQWLPDMVEAAKNENPCCTVVPLDLTVRTASDVAAVEAALEAGLYVRSLQVDVRVNLESFINLKKAWSTRMGDK